MTLIMPSQDKKNASVGESAHKTKEISSHGGTGAKGRKKVPKSLEATTSLNVASLKRLLPIGLNMFGGREQKLLQLCKERLIAVSHQIYYFFISYQLYKTIFLIKNGYSSVWCSLRKSQCFVIGCDKMICHMTS